MASFKYERDRLDSRYEYDNLVTARLCMVSGCSYIWSLRDPKFAAKLKSHGINVRFDYDDDQPTFDTARERDMFAALVPLEIAQRKMAERIGQAA